MKEAAVLSEKNAESMPEPIGEMSSIMSPNEKGAAPVEAPAEAKESSTEATVPVEDTVEATAIAYETAFSAAEVPAAPSEEKVTKDDNVVPLKEYADIQAGVEKVVSEIETPHEVATATAKDSPVEATLAEELTFVAEVQAETASIGEAFTPAEIGSPSEAV
ncbi:hypothetical protein BGZ65_001891, partial [Modicella reniformis]